MVLQRGLGAANFSLARQENQEPALRIGESLHDQVARLRFKGQVFGRWAWQIGEFHRKTASGAGDDWRIVEQGRDRRGV